MLLHKFKYVLFLIPLSVLLYILVFYGGGLIFNEPKSILGIAVAITMFIFFELFVILFTDRKNKTINSRQTINLFLGYKIIRIFLSIIFLAIYAALVKVELKLFIGIFLIIYLIYLFFDTIYLLKREKILKQSN